MFNDLEDYIIAGAALYVGLVFGKELYESASDAFAEVKQMKAESSSEWDTWTLDRYSHVGGRLDNTNASKAARLEAFEHANMLITKHLEFYVTNNVARESALAFNAKYIESIRNIYA